MKSTALFAALSFSLLAATGARAETYDGVSQPVSYKSRADVAAEAVATAAAPDQNVASGSRGESFASTADVNVVRAGAVAAAGAPNQNVVPGSRYNSRIVPTMPNRAEALAQSGAKAAK